MVEEHELGFKKAAILFNVPIDDEHFDVGNDVY